jgi:hypothetical protein
MSKSMILFRKTWGIEWVIKIFEAYSHLQRMATVLGWTLEINHFFVSMFGNTLAFSKLPLKDILATQKDIMNNFLAIANDIYKFACDVNCEQQYKWHKNLQMTENELFRVRFHIEKCVGIISVIETEHLDYEAQVRRLRDVTARFQPLMNRIDCNLSSIQEELGLTYSKSEDHRSENMLADQQDKQNLFRIEDKPSQSSKHTLLLGAGSSSDYEAGAKDSRRKSGSSTELFNRVEELGEEEEEDLRTTKSSKDSTKRIDDMQAKDGDSEIIQSKLQTNREGDASSEVCAIC